MRLIQMGRLELRSLGCDEVYPDKVAKDTYRKWASLCVVTNIQVP
jgi:hypothetical protein